MNVRTIAAMSVLAAALAGGADAQDQPSGDAASSQATSPDVNLTPRRLVFGPRERGVKEITVFNKSNATATYTIVLTDRVMTSDGALVEPDKAPAATRARLKSALDYIRYSPRQMVLGPRESQTVRLQVRPPAGGAPAEYRTHFSVTAMPPASAGTDIAAAASGAPKTGLEVRITPVYGIMIPIVVRTGDLSAQTSISNVHSAGARALAFTINRAGDRSVYGGIDVFLLNSGSAKKIAGIRGLGVYEEIDQRQVTLPLDRDAPSIGPGSQVRIVYTDDELDPGKVLAKTEVTLK